MNKKIIYVAGPYRSDTENGVYENINNAREAAVELWKLGWIVICPHLNTYFMGGILTNDEFIEADLEIVKRCDAIFMLKYWHKSAGALKEIELAKKLGLELLIFPRPPREENK